MLRSCARRHRTRGALLATVMALTVGAIPLQVGASYPDVPWTIDHSDDLAPVSSGARYAWCDLTFQARKGDSLEVGWHSDGPVNFYLFGPDGSRLTYRVMLSLSTLTWSIAADGAHKVSWSNPTDRPSVHINYTVSLERAVEGRAAKGGGWGLPDVHVDMAPIVASLPYVAVGLIGALAGLVGALAYRHRLRHPRPGAVRGRMSEGYISAYCSYPPESVMGPGLAARPGGPEGPRGPPG